MLVSQSQYAKDRGVSRAYINKLVKQGKLPHSGGKIDPATADAAQRNNQERPRRATRSSPPSQQESRQTAFVDGPSLTQARTVLETYRAKRAKLEYERECGRLVDVEDVRKAQEKAYSIVRARLLQLPAKLTPALAGLTRAEIKVTLETEIHAALTELVATAGNVDGN